MKNLAGPLAAFLAFLVHPARAQDAATSPIARPEGAGPDPQALPKDGPRLRFGIGGTLSAGVGLKPGRQGSAVEVVPGLCVDIGVQASDKAALYVRAEGGTLVFLNHGAAYAVAEWSPLAWLSLGTGIGVDAMSSDLVGSQADWAGVSIPLVVGFNAGGRSGSSARRSGLRVGLEFAAGIEPATSSPGYHGELAFGWTTM